METRGEGWHQQLGLQKVQAVREVGATKFSRGPLQVALLGPNHCFQVMLHSTFCKCVFVCISKPRHRFTGSYDVNFLILTDN